jgi:hypothetical protein
MMLRWVKLMVLCALGAVAPGCDSSEPGPAKLKVLDRLPNLMPPSVGQPFVRQLGLIGGTPPYTWMLSGAKASGLTDADGVISGTSDRLSYAAYIVQVDDAAGKVDLSSFPLFTLQGGPPTTFTIGMPLFPPTFTTDGPLGFRPAIQGGAQPWTISYTGLPPGVQVDPATGALSGAATQPGAFDVDLSAKDASGTKANNSPQRLLFVVKDSVDDVGPGCPTEYEGKYFGMMAYDWEKGDPANPPLTKVTDAIQINFELKCIAAGNGTVGLQVLNVKASGSCFDCAGGCDPVYGSMAGLPTNPPTTVMNPSRRGHSIVIIFPNGAIIVIVNDVDDTITVTSGARKLSNSPKVKGKAWFAICGSTKQFPREKHSAAPATIFTSWKFDQALF